MLAVASERFPKGGAVAIGLMGGVGMLSAGLLGGPAIGYKQDYFASKNLQTTSPEAYARYSVDQPKGFLVLPAIKGLDGAKVGVLSDQGKELANVDAALAKAGKTDPNHEKLKNWWASAQATADKDAPVITAATLEGGRSALKVTAIVPAVMAAIYLLLIFYFKAKGGYKAMHIEGEKMTGGVQAAVR
jgi:hypothetical protein